MAHEFNIKNGFITSGQSYVYQNLTVSGLTLSAVPANDDTLTQILARDSSGNVKYRTASSLGGGGTTGAYLPLSGGTVSGNTYFTSGLSANTLYVSGLTQTSGLTSTGGIIFPQKTINSSYTALTTDYMIDVTGGTFNVQLPTAVGVQGKLLCVKNNGGGAVTVYPYGTETIDEKPFIILSETNAIQLVSNGSYWVILGQDRSTVNNSTGVFVFTGMSKVSSTQFSVAPVRAWITDVTTNPLSPQIYYVYFSGGTYTDNFISTASETFVYLTSGGTIQQQSTPLTEQQRRQNIFLGKIGHPDKTSINLVFSQPDYVLSPLSQLRDMFVPINLINGGVYPSANGANLKFNTSAGYLYGLGINFSVDTLNPNAIYISGNTPTTFQYRTQTGGTTSNVTDIDPLNYDVNGVLTPITGTKATNQRIYLLQNGSIRVQYGQTEYNQLSTAIAGIQNETFVVFPNWINNAVLIGILSVLSTATDLSDTTKAQFLLVSKFGETVGAAGGISTTNLQQAYNNSTTPEIIINSTLDGLSIKNGTGNADNVTNLLEGVSTAGATTSFIRADGAFSGNSVTASTIFATTYLNLPTDIRVTGGTYSAGTATFTNNTGGTFTVTGFSTSTATSFTGGTVTGATNFTGGLTANTISATTYVNLPVSGLTQGSNITITNNGQGNYTISSTGGGSGSFTGGTVSGATTFISGVTANTLIYSVVTLTSGATISVNAVLGNEFKVTLGGNSVLGNPTGAVDGQYLRFAIRQDSSGNRNLTFDTKYRFGNEIGTPSVDLTANKTSYLGVRYNSADDKFDVISFVSGY